jgi:hypothetical protein
METKNLPAVIQTAVTAQKIELDKVNLMLPSQTFGEVLGAYDKVTLEVIQVNTDPAAKEVFKISGEFALTRVTLDKIATSLSIQWNPQNTGIVESTIKISRAKATGMMRKPNGEQIVRSDEKTINMDVIDEELEYKAEEEADKRTFKSDAERNTWIAKQVRTGRMQKLKFKDELAVTGAINRVIRKFIGIKGTYTAAELARPFVFPRVTLDTNKMLQDPQLRGAAIGMLSGSAAALYGPSDAVHEQVDQKQIPEAPAIAGEAEVDDWFESAPIPQETMEQKHLREVRETLEEYYNSDYLNENQKTKVKALLDDETTSIVDLEKYLRRCKDQEKLVSTRGPGVKS